MLNQIIKTVCNFVSCQAINYGNIDRHLQSSWSIKSTVGSRHPGNMPDPRSRGLIDIAELIYCYHSNKLSSLMWFPSIFYIYPTSPSNGIEKGLGGMPKTRKRKIYHFDNLGMSLIGRRNIFLENVRVRWCFDEIIRSSMLTNYIRAEWHEYGLRRLGEDDLDADAVSWKVGDEVNLRDLQDRVQLPENISIWAETELMFSWVNCHHLSLKMKAERFLFCFVFW